MLVQAIRARYIELLLADRISSLSIAYSDAFPGYNKLPTYEMRNRFVHGQPRACLFDDVEMRLNIWTSVTTV